MSDKQKKERMKSEGKQLKPIIGQDEKEATFLIQRLKLIEKEKKKQKLEKRESGKKWKENWQAGMEKDVKAAASKHKQEKFKKQQRTITANAKRNKD